MSSVNPSTKNAIFFISRKIPIDYQNPVLKKPVVKKSKLFNPVNLYSSKFF